MAAIIAQHGDDRGLVLPPRVAPIKCVIVPILYKEKDREEIIGKARGVAETLNSAGLDTILDDREEYTPGWKYNEWELRGVPVRIELGPRDMAKGEVTLVRRDTGERSSTPEHEVVGRVRSLLEDIQANLYSRAKAFLEGMISEAHSYKEFRDKIEGKGGFVKACWCGSRECEDAIKEETGADIRLIPIEEEKVFSSCIYCGREAAYVAYFGRAY